MLESRWHSDVDLSGIRVELADQEYIFPDDIEFGLVNAAARHPEDVSIMPCAHVAVANLLLSQYLEKTTARTL